MKKQLIPLTIALALASCSMEEGTAVTGGSGGNDILRACAEELDHTRATLEEGSIVKWSDGDAISVVGSSIATFTLAEGSGTATGTFSGDISAAGSAPYFALYPAGGNVSLSDGFLRFDVARERESVPGIAKSEALPMVADVKGAAANFHNLFGLLKVVLVSEKTISLSRMTLHDSGGNMLWGRCSVPVKGDTLAYDSVSLTGGDNSTSIIFPSGMIVSSTPSTVYFCVPPGSLDRGFSIAVYLYDESRADKCGDAYTFIQKITSPVAAQRSVVIDMNQTSLIDKTESADVKARGFYKTLFVDGGLGLTHMVESSDLPWIKAMGLEDDCEYLSVSNTKERDSITALGLLVSAPQGQDAVWNDANGILLYPDGKPRFRTLYLNGGNSQRHGKSLSQEGRDRYHDYYYKGGSYVASCAGAFLACRYVDGKNSYNNDTESNNFTFGIFPGNLVHTSMPVSITTYGGVLHAIKALTDFGDFAEGDTLDLVYHHGGGYLPYSYNWQLNPQPERLFSYQYTGDPRSAVDSTLYTYYNLMHYPIHGKIKNKVDSTCIWAYKNSNTTGRAVLCGSHPEDNVSPSQITLMRNMIDYALSGTGSPTYKDVLTDGVERKMEASWSDGTPTYARIGDRQYHHFRINASGPIENFRLVLDSDYGKSSGIDLYLSLRKGGVAWLYDADYLLCNRGGQKELNIKTLPAGTWYVGVYCATTVVATKKAPTSYLKYYSYSGKTETLDGIAYSIKYESAATAPQTKAAIDNKFDD